MQIIGGFVELVNKNIVCEKSCGAIELLFNRSAMALTGHTRGTDLGSDSSPKSIDTCIRYKQYMELQHKKTIRSLSLLTE